MADDLKARMLRGVPDAEVELDGVGTIRVRGLTRSEMLQTVKQGDIDAQGNPDMTRVEAIERRMLVAGLVDPEMTEDEVAQWQRTAPSGDVEQVVNRITELSGIMPGQRKELTKSVHGRPGANVRAVPRRKAR